jgi:hypothetical protein
LSAPLVAATTETAFKGHACAMQASMARTALSWVLAMVMVCRGRPSLRVGWGKLLALAKHRLASVILAGLALIAVSRLFVQTARALVMEFATVGNAYVALAILGTRAIYPSFLASTAAVPMEHVLVMTGRNVFVIMVGQARSARSRN